MTRKDRNEHIVVNAILAVCLCGAVSQCSRAEARGMGVLGGYAHHQGRNYGSGSGSMNSGIPADIQQGTDDPSMDTQPREPQPTDDPGWSWVLDSHGRMTHVYTGENK